MMRCVACKFWNAPTRAGDWSTFEGESDWGACALAGFAGPVDSMPSKRLFAGICAEGMVTAPNFGCVHFEAK